MVMLDLCQLHALVSSCKIDYSLAAKLQQHMQSHKVQRLDIAEVARLGRDNEQASSSSQDIKLEPGHSEDEKPKVDKSSNQTAGMAPF